MDQLNLATVKQIISLPKQPTVSLYMPVVKSGPDQQQNAIRLSNLIREARTLLDSSKLTTHKLKESLSALETESQAEDFWQHLSLGAAFFVYENEFKAYRLPLDVPERVYLDSHHFLKPLLPLLTTNGNFFVLSLSQNDIKLYEATRTAIDKRFLGDTPRSIKEHLDYDDLDSHLQHHTGSGKSAVYHGQGAGDESIKADISQFLNEVENHITNILSGETAPLILAGVNYLTTIYAGHNKYPHLLDQTIDGSPDQTTKQDLHTKAWEIVRPVFKQKESEAIENFGNLHGTGKTSTDRNEIILAAIDGKIDTLFVTRDLVTWGKYNHKTRNITDYQEHEPNCRDLFDLATFFALNSGGTVYSLKPEEMKADFAGATIAAIFRY